MSEALGGGNSLWSCWLVFSAMEPLPYEQGEVRVPRAPALLACDLLVVGPWNLACSTQQGAGENESPGSVPSGGTTVTLHWEGRERESSLPGHTHLPAGKLAVRIWGRGTKGVGPGSRARSSKVS